MESSYEDEEEEMESLKNFSQNKEVAAPETTTKESMDTFCANHSDANTSKRNLSLALKVPWKIT